eukprot:jgi/Picsp_1/3470/NSC_06308-R1_nucleic acid binding
MLYTRGGASDKDDRGVSMVELHRSKLQRAREEVAMRKLRPVVPEILSNAILLEALRRYEYNVDAAISSLRHFMEDERSELKALHRKKEERKSHLLEEHGISLRQEDSPSTSSREAGSIDSEDGSRERKKRRHGRRSRHDKKRRVKRSSRRRGYSSSSESESEPSGDDRHGRKIRKSRDRKTRQSYDEERRRRKREKHSSRKDKGKRAGQERYGKYGVIRETDIYSKRPEFMLWSMEEKNKDVENLSRFDEKELFKTFMDEYNLATLPHKKYYDLERYEMSKKSRERKTGNTERMVFDDEAERRKEIEEQRLKEKDERLRQAYTELKSSSKAQDMREQELLRAKMDLAYRTGDQKEAERLAERLKPDEA